MSQAVTSQPRSSIGRKLLPVPQPTSSRRLPLNPWRSQLRQQVAQPQLVVVMGGEVVVDGSDRLVGDLRPTCLPFLAGAVMPPYLKTA